MEIQLPNTYQGTIELSCFAVYLTDFLLPQAKFYICSNKVDIFNCILDDMWIEMEQLKILSSSINEIHIFRYKYATDDLVDIVINDSKIGEFIVPCHSNNFSFSNTHFQKLVLANGRCLVGSSSEVDSIYVERYNRVILTDTTLHQVESSFCNEIYYNYCNLEKGGCTWMNGGTLKLFHHDYQLVKDSSGLLLKKEDEIKHTIKVQKGKVLSKKKYITKKVMDISQK